MDAFARVAMAYLEKHRNGVYVVGRAERKISFIFEPVPQLKVESTSAGRLELGWIPLACSISLSYMEPTCNTKHEFQKLALNSLPNIFCERPDPSSLLLPNTFLSLSAHCPDWS